MTADADAILVGGPHDGEEFAAEDAALVELEIEGMIHRYIRTSQQRGADGSELTVFNYDGMVSPEGGQPGVEHPRERLASPLAKSNEEEAGP